MNEWRWSIPGWRGRERTAGEEVRDRIDQRTNYYYRLPFLFFFACLTREEARSELEDPICTHISSPIAPLLGARKEPLNRGLKWLSRTFCLSSRES